MRLLAGRYVLCQLRDSESTAVRSECVCNAHWQHSPESSVEKQNSESLSINLVNNSVNPSLWDKINTNSSSGKNIGTPASMLSYSVSARLRVSTKTHFPPQYVLSLPSKHHFLKWSADRFLCILQQHSMARKSLSLSLLSNGSDRMSWSWSGTVIYSVLLFFWQYCDEGKSTHRGLWKQKDYAPIYVYVRYTQWHKD